MLILPARENVIRNKAGRNLVWTMEAEFDAVIESPRGPGCYVQSGPRGLLAEDEKGPDAKILCVPAHARARAAAALTTIDAGAIPTAQEV